MKKIIEKILKLQMEKQLRCGDGGGKKITSHSLNCDCENINKQIKKLKREMDSLL